MFNTFVNVLIVTWLYLLSQQSPVPEYFLLKSLRGSREHWYGRNVDHLKREHMNILWALLVTGLGYISDDCRSLEVFRTFLFSPIRSGGRKRPKYLLKLCLMYYWYSKTSQIETGGAGERREIESKR